VGQASVGNRPVTTLVRSGRDAWSLRTWEGLVRKVVGWISLGLGAFLIMASVMASTWATDRVEKTPLDVDSVTRLDGTAQRINTTTGGLDEFDVRATSYTQADSEASDDDVVVFVSYSCLVKDIPDTPDCGEPGQGENADPNIINVSEPSVFATDRRTAEAINDDGYLPEGTSETVGLVNKWPFGAEQTDYEVWDGLLGEPVTATFEGEEELEGLDTYVYNVALTDEPAVVTGDIEGLYSQDKTYWIEPHTGSIIKQTQVEQRTLEDGTVLLELDIAFTDDQVATNVSDSEESVSSLTLITSTVPSLGLWIGIPLVVLGLGLLVVGRRSSGKRKDV